MSVFKHQGKWRYEFMVRGERYSKSGYETKQAARDAEAEVRKDLKRMNFQFIRLCASRLKDLKVRRTKKYLKENARLIKKLIKLWRAKKTITRQDVEEFLLGIEAVHMRNAALRQVKALFNHGIEREWFTYNPAGNIKPYPVARKKKYIPSQDDVRKILQVASARQRAYILVLLHTLGRSSSVNALRWEDIQADYLVLRTRKAKNSNVKEIRVPINNVLQEALAGIPHNEEYVFFNRKTGRPYDYRDGIIPSLCRKAGVRRFTLHAIRHFSASLLDNAGVPLSDIQALLGHESATTTAIYLQSLRGSTTEAVKKLENLK